jgi:hypothetical protein
VPRLGREVDANHRDTPRHAPAGRLLGGHGVDDDDVALECLLEDGTREADDESRGTVLLEQGLELLPRHLLVGSAPDNLQIALALLDFHDDAGERHAVGWIDSISAPLAERLRFGLNAVGGPFAQTRMRATAAAAAP